MCVHYTPKPYEEQISLRDKIVIYGAVPHSDVWPLDFAPILLPDDDEFKVLQMRWGWSVPWDKKPLVNARSETVTTLGTFKPYLENRCLILANGFYEKKIRFVQPDQRLFAMAGLWRMDGDEKRFTMLTTTPNETILPCFLKPDFSRTV
jgi:putative SOS response-associated peptidase YedK